MPSTSTLVDSIYTRRVSAGECYPPDLVKSQKKYQEALDTLLAAEAKLRGKKIKLYQLIVEAAAKAKNPELEKAYREKFEKLRQKIRSTRTTPNRARDARNNKTAGGK